MKERSPSNMDIAICPDLRPVYDYEVAQGNVVTRIDAPAGTECEYAIIFGEPLKSLGIPDCEDPPDFMSHWECRDSHYPIEAGFFCREHRHCIAGPIHD
jgi:hypothetical protein